MKRNKIIALLLCSAMACGILGGCGEKNDAPVSAEPQGSSTAGGQQPESGGEQADGASRERELLPDGNTYATGLPIVKDKVTFRIARGQNALDSGTDTNEKPIMKLMEEATNIHIEWIDVPAGDGFAEQMSILLSTDLPDAFMGGVGTTDIMKDYDSFVPLNGMMETYAPHIMETYEKTNGEAIDMLTFPNGNIYSFMSSVYTQHASWTIGVQFINKKWLDNVGKEIPRTLDEFYEVLKAFQEMDANGNGDPNDEIPLGYCENNFQARLIQFMGAFGFNDYFRIEDGKVIPTANTDEYRQFLEYYNKLASEGLLDIEGFSQTDQQFMAKAKQGLYGSFFAWTPDTIIDDEELANEYVQLLPMTAPGLEGKETVYGTVNRFMGSVNGFVITSACEYPEALVRWYDYMGSSTEMKQTARIGEEGVMWEKRDGKIYELQNQGPDFNFQNACYTYGFMQTCPVLLYPDELAAVDPEISPQNYARESYVTAVEGWILEEGLMPSRIATEEATLELASYETDLQNYISNFTANAIMSGVTDASWEQHLADLEKYRYSDWIAWKQNYLDGNF